jgi:hypothetical protein
VEQDRYVQCRNRVEERRELRRVERLTFDVGVDLNRTEAQVANGALQLPDRGVDLVHRHAGGAANEALGKPRHEIGHLVVRNPREFQRLLRTSNAFDRRIGGVNNLDVPVARRVHHAKPRVKIEQCGHHPFLFLEPGGELQPRVAILRRDDVIENVDLHRNSELGIMSCE